MTSKQRSYLKSLAMKEDAILQIGKGSVSSELAESVREALDARELIKISILQNCLDDPEEMARFLAERTQSEVVQIIGHKIVLYKEGKGERKKIWLPGQKNPAEPSSGNKKDSGRTSAAQRAGRTGSSGRSSRTMTSERNRRMDAPDKRRRNASQEKGGRNHG